MIQIKIECGCGQHYAFDVEPVEGRMPHQVACPVCGTDGTSAADDVIAQYAPPPVAVAAPAVRVAAPARPPAGRYSGRPEPDRDKVLAEARSKVCWGDSTEDVIKFVMMQGLPRAEAQEMVQALQTERVSMLRGIGIRKIITGIPLMCVPVGAFFGFMHFGYLPIKLFALTVMVGLYGTYLVFKGCFMVFLPRMEGGDVADK